MCANNSQRAFRKNSEFVENSFLTTKDTKNPTLIKGGWGFSINTNCRMQLTKIVLLIE